MEIGDTQNDKTVTEIESKFSEKTPLLARKKAFNQCERIKKWILLLNKEKYLELTDPEKAKERGYKNYTMWSCCVWKIDSLTGEEEPIIGESYDDDLESFILEYEFYEHYGFETGDTMTVKGKDGADQKILKTDLALMG